ncbi:MAG: anti-sigma E factor RseA, partial [Mycobacterium sp.]
SLCPDCATEVDDQSRARAALRDSRPIRIPSTLLGLLAQIPHSSPDDGVGRSGLSDQLADGNPRDRRDPR